MITKSVTLQYLTLAAPVLFLLTTSVGAGAQDLDRQLTVEQVGIQNVTAPPSTTVNPLTVNVGVDRADSTYAQGERVQLWVQANKAAYVTVLNVATTGQITVLFPNAFQSDNRVPANTRVLVPDPLSGTAIRVNEPFGPELIKVIASTMPRSPVQAMQLANVGPFRRVGATASQLAQSLEVVMTDQAGGEWDDVSTSILTVPQRQTVAVVSPGGGLGSAVAGFRLQFESDKQRYRLTEPVRLMVRSDRDCHLTLINTGPTGNMRQIFPNRYQQQTLIPGGQTIVVPGLGEGVAIRPIGPTGVEQVTAICRAGAQLAGVRTDFTAEAFPRLSRNLEVTPTGPTAGNPVGTPAATATSTVTFFVAN